MPTVLFFIADSFTRTRFAGNPAGVVLHRNDLTGAQMQSIAAELHLESAFLAPAAGDDADYDVAYYTGAGRVPLCGHDTIAAAIVLAQSGRLRAPGVVRFATDVGILRVEVTEQGEAVMEQALPRYGEKIGAEEAAAALGLPVSAVAETGKPVQTVSTGTPFVMVPVGRRALLSELKPDMARLEEYLASLPGEVAGLYVWTSEAVGGDAAVHARCFAPAVGLPEDPVTGTASGALGAYLVRHGFLRPDAGGSVAFMTEQGYAMGRPGHARVLLEVSGDVVTRVRVGGPAVLVAEGTLWV